MLVFSGLGWRFPNFRRPAQRVGRPAAKPSFPMRPTPTPKRQVSVSTPTIVATPVSIKSSIDFVTSLYSKKDFAYYAYTDNSGAYVFISTKSANIGGNAAMLGVPSLGGPYSRQEMNDILQKYSSKGNVTIYFVEPDSGIKTKQKWFSDGNLLWQN